MHIHIIQTENDVKFFRKNCSGMSKFEQNETNNSILNNDLFPT